VHASLISQTCYLWSSLTCFSGLYFLACVVCDWIPWDGSRTDQCWCHKDMQMTSVRIDVSCHFVCRIRQLTIKNTFICSWLAMTIRRDDAHMPTVHYKHHSRTVMEKKAIGPNNDEGSHETRRARQCNIEATDRTTITRHKSIVYECL